MFLKFIFSVGQEQKNQGKYLFDGIIRPKFGIFHSTVLNYAVYDAKLLDLVLRANLDSKKKDMKTHRDLNSAISELNKKIKTNSIVLVGNVFNIPLFNINDPEIVSEGNRKTLYIVKDELHSLKANALQNLNISDIDIQANLNRSPYMKTEFETKLGEMSNIQNIEVKDNLIKSLILSLEKNLNINKKPVMGLIDNQGGNIKIEYLNHGGVLVPENPLLIDEQMINSEIEKHNNYMISENPITTGDFCTNGGIETKGFIKNANIIERNNPLKNLNSQKLGQMFSIEKMTINKDSYKGEILIANSMIILREKPTSVLVNRGELTKLNEIFKAEDTKEESINKIRFKTISNFLAKTERTELGLILVEEVKHSQKTNNNSKIEITENITAFLDNYFGVSKAEIKHGQPIQQFKELQSEKIILNGLMLVREAILSEGDIKALPWARVNKHGSLENITNAEIENLIKEAKLNEDFLNALNDRKEIHGELMNEIMNATDYLPSYIMQEMLLGLKKNVFDSVKEEGLFNSNKDMDLKKSTILDILKSNKVVNQNSEILNTLNAKRLVEFNKNSILEKEIFNSRKDKKDKTSFISGEIKSALKISERIGFLLEERKQAITEDIYGTMEDILTSDKAPKEAYELKTILAKREVNETICHLIETMISEVKMQFDSLFIDKSVLGSKDIIRDGVIDKTLDAVAGAKSAEIIETLMANRNKLFKDGMMFESEQEAEKIIKDYIGKIEEEIFGGTNKDVFDANTDIIKYFGNRLSDKDSEITKEEILGNRLGDKNSKIETNDILGDKSAKESILTREEILGNRLGDKNSIISKNENIADRIVSKISSYLKKDVLGSRFNFDSKKGFYLPEDKKAIGFESPEELYPDIDITNPNIDLNEQDPSKDKDVPDRWYDNPKDPIETILEMLIEIKNRNQGLDMKADETAEWLRKLLEDWLRKSVDENTDEFKDLIGLIDKLIESTLNNICTLEYKKNEDTKVSYLKDFEEPSSWYDKDFTSSIAPPPSTNPGSGSWINVDLTKPSGATAQQLDVTFAKNGGHLAGLGQACVDAEAKYGVNAYYIASHACWESAWGKSKISRDKNNLFGYGAYDSSPYESAWTFKSKAECIDVVMKNVANQYLKPNGKYWGGSPTLKGMNKMYATDMNWANGISSIMNQFAGGNNPPNDSLYGGGEAYQSRWYRFKEQEEANDASGTQNDGTNYALHSPDRMNYDEKSDVILNKKSDADGEMSFEYKLIDPPNQSKTTIMGTIMHDTMGRNDGDLQIPDYQTKYPFFSGYGSYGWDMRAGTIQANANNSKIEFNYDPQGLGFIKINTGFKYESPIPTNGTIVVRYVDESGNDIIASDVHRNLAWGTYTYNAKDITGYILIDAISKSATISSSEPYKEIVFVYRVLPDNPPQYGSVTIVCKNTSGNRIQSDVTYIGVDLNVLRSFNAPEIDNYQLKDSSPKYVTLTSQNPSATITFVYEKIPMGTITVLYVDMYDYFISSATHLTKPYGTHHINAKDIDGYVLNDYSPKTVILDANNTHERVIFRYRKEAPPSQVYKYVSVIEEGCTGGIKNGVPYLNSSVLKNGGWKWTDGLGFQTAFTGSSHYNLANANAVYDVDFGQYGGRISLGYVMWCDPSDHGMQIDIDGVSAYRRAGRYSSAGDVNANWYTPVIDVPPGKHRINVHVTNSKPGYIALDFIKIEKKILTLSTFNLTMFSGADSIPVTYGTKILVSGYVVNAEGDKTLIYQKTCYPLQENEHIIEVTSNYLNSNIKVEVEYFTDDPSWIGEITNVEILGDTIGYLPHENSILEFYIDGVKKGTYSGETLEWTEQKFQVIAGTHEYKWIFINKDRLNDGNISFALIDNIKISNMLVTEEPYWKCPPETGDDLLDELIEIIKKKKDDKDKENEKPQDWNPDWDEDGTINDGNINFKIWLYT